MRVPSKRIIASLVVALAAAGVAYFAWHSDAPTIAIPAEKVPNGWYEHNVALEGASSTLTVLTKHPTLPVRAASDGQYDDPEITIMHNVIDDSPEEYVAGQGLSGANAAAMGIKGSWDTFMGHRRFTIDLDQVGHSVMLFGPISVYSFTLSATDTQDIADFQNVLAFYAQPEFYVDSTVWKTYTDPSTGFTIGYPPKYAVQQSPPPPTEWGSRTLLQISNPASTSTGEFTIGPAQVTLQKQPLTASGVVYHTIAAYQKGIAAQMVQGAPNPKGDLMILPSGEHGLFYSYPANPDTGTDPIDEYFFIKNDLLYSVSFDANDPNEEGMLESVIWR